MPSSSPEDTVKLFLSYAREDFDAVSALYDRLEALGLRPWMDKRDLLPGQRRREIIPRQVQQSDLVLVCLSPQSVDKRGFFQREIRTALDAWREKLQADIYLIPVRLAVCEVPEEVGEFNWVDLYDKDGWRMLLRSIAAAARGLGRSIPGELAEALASKKNLPPADRTAEPAKDASRTAAVDADLCQTVDSERAHMLEERNSIERQLAELRRNLRLIEERKAEYVQEIEIPLQLVKDEQSLRERIATLEAKKERIEQLPVGR